MALVQEKVFINVTLTDAGGNKSGLSVETNYADMDALNTAHTTNDEIFGAGGIIPDLEAVTDATVTGVSFGVQYREDSTLYGAAGSEVERIALVSAKENGGIDNLSIRIPAPDVDIFLAAQGPDRNTVDQSDTDVQNWLANYGAAGHLRVAGKAIADPAVAGNWKGKQIHRGSRKG